MGCDGQDLTDQNCSNMFPCSSLFNSQSPVRTPVMDSGTWRLTGSLYLLLFRHWNNFFPLFNWPIEDRQLNLGCEDPDSDLNKSG